MNFLSRDQAVFLALGPVESPPGSSLHRALALAEVATAEQRMLGAGAFECSGWDWREVRLPWQGV